MAIASPASIKDLIICIENKEILLPAIQREFVWKKSQIITFFDSLMNDYPIGSFLFWDVKKEKFKDFQFYEFLKDFHVKQQKHNIKAEKPNLDSIFGVLDGQQRLTALYLGLKGSYSEKRKGKRQSTPDSYEKKFLYINLLSQKKNEESEFQFDFLTEEQANKKNEDNNTLWFKLHLINSFDKPVKISNYLNQQEKLRTDEKKWDLASTRLFDFDQIIKNKQIIYFFIEKEQNLDKVLKIFIRANTGGTKLDYSDLLLSIATAQWKNRDARQEMTSFVDRLNDYGNGFKFNKDFVLKAALVIQDDLPSIKFKADNFKKSNMHKIEDNWEKITKSIESAVSLISTFGYQERYLPQQLPIIPIAHYFSKKDPAEIHKIINSTKSGYVKERKIMKDYLVASMLKLLFSQHPDEALTTTRSIIKNEPKTFPIDIIKKNFIGNKSIFFDEYDISDLMDYEYGDKLTFTLLTLYYPNYDYRNIFHIDHIYPESIFNKKKLKSYGITENAVQERYLSKYNSFPNLQLIDGQKNIDKSKKLPEDWFNSEDFNENRERYHKQHFIPQDFELTVNNFESFIEARRELLIAEFNRNMSKYIRKSKD